MRILPSKLLRLALPALLAGSALVGLAPAALADTIGPQYWDACARHGTMQYVDRFGVKWTVPSEQVQYGDTGDCVKEAQAMLVDWGRLPSAAWVDGQFGPRTQSATIAQQSFCNIGRDGIVGPQTWVCMLRAG